MKKPPFCPSSICPHHHSPPKGVKWFRRAGTYETDTFGTVQRFKCLTCGKGFSVQTFSLNYFAKKIVNYHQLVLMLKSASGIRDMGRDLRVSTGTIQNRLSRLSRQAIALHETITQSIALAEDLAADGFQSFVVSQYFPDNITTLVGKDSQYVYHFNYVTIRRNGRMTETQKQRREELEQLFLADRGGIEHAFYELAKVMGDLFFRSPKASLTLYTDEKKEYPRALKRIPLFADMAREGRFIHSTVSSHHARVPGGPLFSVDYIEREFRKDLSNHVRETVQFSRNVNDGIGRLFIYNLYHNCKKSYRINKAQWAETSHADVAGASRKVVDREFATIFSRRRFLSRLEISVNSFRVWLRQLETPLKKRGEYLPAYAMM